MKSTAATVEQYLGTLPDDRREAISTVRKFILKTLGKGFQECMQYGVIAYCVPHSVWPHGHHTRPELPLMYMGLSSQKNDMVVYMLFMQHDTAMRAWFDKAWKATGKKSYLDVGGMGCCLRFKKLEDLSLEVIGEAIKRMPMKTYLGNHTKMLESIGKAPGGQKNVKASAPRKRKSTKATTASDVKKNSGTTPKKRFAKRVA